MAIPQVSDFESIRGVIRDFRNDADRYGPRYRINTDAAQRFTSIEEAYISVATEINPILENTFKTISENKSVCWLSQHQEYTQAKHQVFKKRKLVPFEMEGFARQLAARHEIPETESSESIDLRRIADRVLMALERRVLYERFWTVQVLHWLHEYLYTNHAEEFLQAGKNFAARVKQAKAAISAIHRDMALIVECYPNIANHRQSDGRYIHYASHLRKFSQFTSQFNDTTKPFEQLLTSPIFKRKDPHLAEQLLVIRLCGLNRDTTRGTSRGATAKHIAVYELMKLPGVRHCYDPDHIAHIDRKHYGMK